MLLLRTIYKGIFKGENFPVTFTKMSKLYDISKIVKFFNLIKKSGITNMFQDHIFIWVKKE